MTTSEYGIALIKKWEGCSLKPYKDVAGYWTIGYGRCLGSKLSERYKNGITKEEADRMLEDDISYAEAEVNKYLCKYEFNQNQYDALVSFSFNIGNIKQLTASGRRTVNEIAEKMPLYCNVAGKKIIGLVKRRAEETALFMTPLTPGENPGIFNNETTPFLYKVTVDNLTIRRGPGTEYSRVTDKNFKNLHTGIGVFTIDEVKDEWGLLHSGAGWISLDGKYGYRLK